jgi:hypothetical protein
MEMKTVEERLEHAAREVREKSRDAVPPPFRIKQHPVPRGWLVFAGAFLVVALGFGLAPLLSGNRDVPPLGAVTSTSLATTTLPSETTVGLDPDAGGCSGSDLPLPAAQDGLPEVVARARDAIALAAVSCDLVALESLADPDFVSSFGGGDFSNILEWEENGRGELDTLVQLFDTRYAVQQFPEMTLYLWPAAFVYESWDEIPDADLEDIIEIFGEGEVDMLAQFGVYAGWRIGITADGDWRFFVAGD